MSCKKGYVSERHSACCCECIHRTGLTVHNVNGAELYECAVTLDKAELRQNTLLHDCCELHLTEEESRFLSHTQSSGALRKVLTVQYAEGLIFHECVVKLEKQ